MSELEYLLDRVGEQNFVENFETFSGCYNGTLTRGGLGGPSWPWVREIFEKGLELAALQIIAAKSNVPASAREGAKSLLKKLAQ